MFSFIIGFYFVFLGYCMTNFASSSTMLLTRRSKISLFARIYRLGMKEYLWWVFVSMVSTAFRFSLSFFTRSGASDLSALRNISGFILRSLVNVSSVVSPSLKILFLREANWISLGSMTALRNLLQRFRADTLLCLGS